MIPLLWDDHVHSSDYSCDGKSTIMEHCQRAVELGLNRLCFTDHLTLDVPFERPVVCDRLQYNKSCQTIESYHRKVLEARKRFPSLFVGFGVEVDYQPELEKDLKEFVEKNEFDFVLAAVHYLEGYCITVEHTAEEYFPGKEVEQVYGDYFDQVLKSIESGLFDSIAHLDVIRRRAVPFFGDLPFNEYEDRVRECARAIAKKGLALEVNSSGFRKIGDSFPSLQALKACREEGVEFVTLGSDSHSTENLANNIDKAIENAKKAGFTHAVRFRNREPEKVRL